MKFTSFALFSLTAATSSSAAVLKRQFYSLIQNGLTGPCKAMTVIFARGTTEAGNVGTIAGPPFFNALATMIGEENLAVQGVDYAADIPGFLAGGDAEGSQNMADLVTQAMTTCPSTKIVMSGYSQGGQLVHNAAEMLGASASGVAGALIFGDPDNGDPVEGVSANNTKIICHDGDTICEGQALVSQPHLTYGHDAEEAATFAAGLRTHDARVGDEETETSGANKIGEKPSMATAGLVMFVMFLLGVYIR